MIGRADLDERVREWGLTHRVVEKDYVLGWVLWGIGTEERLASTWAFKGGTCLKKCYLETYRFSEDLDFSVLPGGPIAASDLRPTVEALLERVNAESGIEFDLSALRLETKPDGRYTEGRIYYRGPLAARQSGTIRLDITAWEEVVRPTELRVISHSYPDTLPMPASVRCYSFVEVFAEMVRFAAANHLCVRLRYQNTTRVIEPYSLRRTEEGNLLLHAIRVDSRKPRAYRVDRIQGVEVTTQSFTPIYRVEFSSVGAITAAPALRPVRIGYLVDTE